jgi:hypothetical protein
LKELGNDQNVRLKWGHVPFFEINDSDTRTGFKFKDFENIYVVLLAEFGGKGDR